MRALIAAGDVFVTSRIRAMLAKENLICDSTDFSQDGLLLDRHYDYDIILLHLTVADIEGYKLLQRLRAARVDTPILILSNRGDLEAKVKFLRFGADDFMIKPIDRRELVARILAIVRRSKGHCESTIRTGKLAVNLDTRVVTVDALPVHLTPKEYGILELLSLRKGTILTKGVFLNHLYGGVDEPQPKIVDILICTLRKKLARATGGSHYIETVRGCGYVLRELEIIPARAQYRIPRIWVRPATSLAKNARRNLPYRDPGGRDPKVRRSWIRSSINRATPLARSVGAAHRQLGPALGRQVPLFRPKFSLKMRSRAMP